MLSRCDFKRIYTQGIQNSTVDMIKKGFTLTYSQTIDGCSVSVNGDFFGYCPQSKAYPVNGRKEQMYAYIDGNNRALQIEDNDVFPLNDDDPEFQFKLGSFEWSPLDKPDFITPTVFLGILLFSSGICCCLLILLLSFLPCSVLFKKRRQSKLDAPLLQNQSAEVLEP